MLSGFPRRMFSTARSLIDISVYLFVISLFARYRFKDVQGGLDGEDVGSGELFL